MGDPKFSRSTYDTPSHPWEGERIKEEHALVRQFGLKNKRELWKVQSILRNFRRQSRELQARLRYDEGQAKLESMNLLKRCGKMGILPMDGATLDDVLTLSPEVLLNRRLQTLVCTKRLARTSRQARQLIIHGHIEVDEKRVTIPGYIVTRVEETKIRISSRSPYADDLHPMRVQQAKSAGPVVDAEPESTPRKKGEKSPKSKESTDIKGEDRPKDTDEEVK